jgi:fumarylacetoacetase
VSEGRAHIAIGDHAADLVRLCAVGLLNGELADGAGLTPLLSGGWRDVRRRVGELLAERSELAEHAERDSIVVPQEDLALEVPVTIGDYVDGYAGLHHATNLGRILRPDGEPLQPNWRHLPVAYHGRAATIVVSGTDIVRPRGQVLVDGAPELRPSAQLDIELELGAIVGVGNSAGEPIPVERAGEHLFGYVLVNDWSARDIQAWEYQPLGPFLGKSFATSVSPWVVTVDALAPFFVRGLAASQDPEPLPYLAGGDPSVPDLHFTVEVADACVSEVDLAPSLYWTPAQQLAHCTVNGATVRPGDLIASGTISGPDHTTQAGSLIERTWRGAEPFTLPSGEQRSFLEDGDAVRLEGWAGDGDARVGFGGVTGTILPARS